MSNNILDNEFNIGQSVENASDNASDIQKALDLINKEHIITDPSEIKPLKKFIVEKNDKLKEIIETNSDDEVKTNAELDEIANQADQAFYDLMDMVVGIGTPSKGTADMASAAQSFLDIKLKSKMAKTELKLKKMKQELDEKKLSAEKDSADVDDNYGTSDSDIIIIDKTNK